MRLFVAFGVPRHVRDACADFQRSVVRASQAEIRPEPGSDLHMTVAFLGERPQEHVEGIREAMDHAVADVALRTIVLSGPVRYRELDRLAMLVFEDDGQGQALWRVLNDRLAERIGYEPQFPDAWLPHISVVRYTEQPNVTPPLLAVPKFSPETLRLYESGGRPSGGRYRIIASSATGAAAAENNALTHAQSLQRGRARDQPRERDGHQRTGTVPLDRLLANLAGAQLDGLTRRRREYE